MKIVSIFLVCCLILTACGSNKATNSDTIKANQQKPTLAVTVEVSGNKAKVIVDTDMSISKSHVGHARSSGEGHIHMYLDDKGKETVTSGIKEYTDLSAGSHIVKVSLHNNDHTPYDVAETIEFEIK